MDRRHPWVTPTPVDTWAAVRGECQGEPIVAEHNRGQSNTFEVAFDCESGDSIVCDIQVAAQLVSVKLDIDLRGIAEAEDPSCEVGNEIVRCTSGSAWFTFEPGEVFDKPMTAVIPRDVWDES